MRLYNYIIYVYSVKLFNLIGVVSGKNFKRNMVLNTIGLELKMRRFNSQSGEWQNTSQASVS